MNRNLVTNNLYKYDDGEISDNKLYNSLFGTETKNVTETTYHSQQITPSRMNKSVKKHRSVILGSLLVTSAIASPWIFSNHSSPIDSQDPPTITKYHNIIDVHGDGDLITSILPVTKKESTEFYKTHQVPDSLFKEFDNTKNKFDSTKTENINVDTKNQNTLEPYSDTQEVFTLEMLSNLDTTRTVDNSAFTKAIKKHDVPIIVNNAKFVNNKQFQHVSNEPIKEDNLSALCYINPLTYKSLINSSGKTQIVKNTTFHCEYTVDVFDRDNRSRTRFTSLNSKDY